MAEIILLHCGDVHLADLLSLIYVCVALWKFCRALMYFEQAFHFYAPVLVCSGTMLLKFSCHDLFCSVSK